MSKRRLTHQPNTGVIHGGWQVDYKNCARCGHSVDKPYCMIHEGHMYFGHKRCMGAPMVAKLNGAPQQAELMIVDGEMIERV